MPSLAGGAKLDERGCVRRGDPPSGASLRRAGPCVDKSRHCYKGRQPISDTETTLASVIGAIAELIVEEAQAAGAGEAAKP